MVAKGSKLLDPVEEIIRANVLRFREESGLSQAQVADISGVPMNNFSRYERGDHPFPASVIVQLSAVFGRPVGDFYASDPGPPPKVDDLDVFFLRTRPGREIDEKIAAEVREALAAANARARGRRPKK